jgi:hypothetical protein
VKAPPFWWWSATKAKKAVVWSNPQAFVRGNHTTVLEASNCRGLGRARLVAGARRFRDFRCSVVWRDDDGGGGPYVGKLFFRTSKMRLYGVACYSRYSYTEMLAIGCP